MPVLVPPVQSALWAAAQQVAARALGRRPPSGLERVAGIACIATGLAGAAGALTRFSRRRTTWEPWAPEQTTSLVTDGPNAVSRNPMYVGMALGLVGTGLLSGRPSTSLAAAGLMATLTPQIRREEAALGQLFGDEWTTYTRRVRRWL